MANLPKKDTIIFETDNSQYLQAVKEMTEAQQKFNDELRITLSLYEAITRENDRKYKTKGHAEKILADIEKQAQTLTRIYEQQAKKRRPDASN